MQTRSYPWFRFYPLEHLTDPRLRLCSLAARGLYVDLLSHSYQSATPGLLMAGSQVMTQDDMPTLLGVSPADVQSAMQQLLARGLVVDRGNGYEVPAISCLVNDRESERLRKRAEREQSRQDAEVEQMQK